MSICFNWFPKSGLGEPIYITIRGVLQCVGILLGW